MASLELSDNPYVTFPDDASPEEIQAISDESEAAIAQKKQAGIDKERYQWVNARANTRAELAGMVAPVAGIAQHVAGLGEGIGILPQGSTEAVTATGQKVQEFIQGSPDEGLTEAQRHNKKVAELATEIAAPIGGALKGIKMGQTVKGALAAGAAGGALGAGVHFDPEVQAAWEANLGLATGALTGGLFLGTVSKLAPAIKNKVLEVLRSPPTKETAKLLTSLRNSTMWKDLEKGLTLGQSTGDVRILQQEGQVSARRAHEFYNDQVEESEKRILSIVKGPQTQTTGQISNDVRTALHKDRVLRRQARNSQYGAAVDEAEALAKTDPTDAYGVKVDNFKTALEENNVSPEQWSAIASYAPAKYRRAVNEALDMLQTNEGRMQMGDLMKTHQALNQLRAGLSAAQANGTLVKGPAASMNRLADDLQGALQRDINHMDSVVDAARKAAAGAVAKPGEMIPGTAYSAAWSKFKQARADFSASMAKENEINSSVLEQTFHFNPRDPEKAFRAIADAELPEQARMVRLLKDNFPEALENLKRWKLQDAVKNAISASAPGLTYDLRVGNLLKELTRGREVSGQAMWTKVELNNIEAGVSYLRLISSRSKMVDRGPEVQRLMMALISRATPFVVGVGWKIGGNPRLEQMFFTEAGRTKLRTLALANPKTPAYAAAIGWLEGATAEALQ